METEITKIMITTETIDLTIEISKMEIKDLVEIGHQMKKEQKRT